jgi:protein TonB
MNPTLPPLSNGSRLTSLGLVAGLHALIVLGLSAGLMRPAAKAPPPPPQVEVLREELPKPKPVKPLVDEAAPQAPVIAQVPLPDEPREATPIITVAPGEQITPRPAEPGPARVPDGSASVVPAVVQPQPAGLLCPTQARPQLPASAQAGRAELRVTGTVAGGRVVAVQMDVLRALPDRRAQRALLAEVDQTLRSGYACTQDGQFVQEFVFRVDD